MPWLMREGEVLASAEEATTRAARRRGLLGRDSLEGVLVLRPCRQVHTLGMRFPLDVIWCGNDGRVLRTASLLPRRISRPVWQARWVIEADHGASARWGLEVGDVLAITEEAGV